MTAASAVSDDGPIELTRCFRRDRFRRSSSSSYSGPGQAAAARRRARTYPRCAAAVVAAVVARRAPENGKTVHGRRRRPQRCGRCSMYMGVDGCGRRGRRSNSSSSCLSQELRSAAESKTTITRVRIIYKIYMYKSNNIVYVPVIPMYLIMCIYTAYFVIFIRAYGGQVRIHRVGR